MNEEKIKKLKKIGYDVKIEHFRITKSGEIVSNYDAKLLGFEKIKNKGGFTEVRIGKGYSYYGGVARCNTSDCFKKSIGVEIALQRAYELLTKI